MWSRIAPFPCPPPRRSSSPSSSSSCCPPRRPRPPPSPTPRRNRTGPSRTAPTAQQRRRRGNPRLAGRKFAVGWASQIKLLAAVVCNGATRSRGRRQATGRQVLSCIFAIDRYLHFSFLLTRDSASVRRVNLGMPRIGEGIVGEILHQRHRRMYVCAAR